MTFTFNVAEGTAMAGFVAELFKQGIRFIVQREQEVFFITLQGF